MRLGFALANEFSDHVTERGNYLWLAHSKLRPASFGPEMLLGDLPQTPSVSENQGSVVIEYQGKYHIKLGQGDWVPYPQ